MKKYLSEVWIEFKNLKGTKRLISYFMILLYAFICIISLVKVNYVITTPGIIAPVSAFIVIEDVETTNPMYTVSVYETRRSTILHYWLALMNKEVAVEIFDPKVELSNKEDEYQGQLMKKAAITNSIIMAYMAAREEDENITIDYTFNGLVVVMKNKLSDENIDLGDIITAIEGRKINSMEEFRQYLGDSEESTVNVTVIRDGKEKDVSITIHTKEANGSQTRYLTFLAYEDYTINNANPSYTEKEAASYGPSGGFMQALAVYDAISNKDLTKGKKILGTGTIDVLGNVGGIGGIKQKVITANIYKADYFLVPVANYEEAMEQYRLLSNPSFPEPVAIATFEEAIEFLLGLGA